MKFINFTVLHEDHHELTGIIEIPKSIGKCAAASREKEYEFKVRKLSMFLRLTLSLQDPITLQDKLLIF